MSEVKPTREEWQNGLGFLARTGEVSKVPELRNEWMLLSDVTGATMLVECINHRKMDPRSTE